MPDSTPLPRPAPPARAPRSEQGRLALDILASELDAAPAATSALPSPPADAPPASAPTTRDDHVSD